MARQRRPRLTATSGIFAAVAVSAVLGLAACGSATAGGTTSSGTNNSAKKSAIQPGGSMVPAGTSTGVAVCTHIPSLVRVTFVRNSGMVASKRMPQMIPVIIKNPSDVRRLATMLCSLPRQPSLMSCPADFGTGYRLAFARSRVAAAIARTFAASVDAAASLSSADASLFSALARFAPLAFSAAFRSAAMRDVRVAVSPFSRVS